MIRMLTTILAMGCLTACVSVPSGGYVDVTSLGAKNDGSADVSAIVNAATEKYDLFFPAGTYRVSAPLRIKRSIRGDGYRREPDLSTGTWFLPDFVCTNGEHGVIEYAAKRPINVENLNIKCAGRECGIVIDSETKVRNLLVSHVAIYNLQAIGIKDHNRGSRRFFADTVTIWGQRWAEGSVGIQLRGNPDSRLTNIEIMGAQIALDSAAGHTYASNLHLWTGCMGGKDNGTWWQGTRAIVLGAGSIFHASNIYPDTSYYAIEARGGGSSCAIDNIMYWDDDTERGSKRLDGTFIKSDDPSNVFTINGGQIENGPGITHVYNPRAVVRDVVYRTAHPISVENFDRLQFTTTLPDYPVAYATNGLCKVADVFTLAKTGVCEAEFSLDDGAVWAIRVLRLPSGDLTTEAKPMNELCGKRILTTRVAEDRISFFYDNSAPSFEGRFRCLRMGDRFRPLDYGSLRTMTGRPRYME